MLGERLLGVGVALAGALILLVLIPAEVSDIPGPVNPSLFPKAAAWVILALGIVQVFATVRTSEPASWRELARLAALAVLTVGAILAMPRVGFLPTAIALMAAVAAMMFERRIGWLLATVAAVPVVTFVLFDVVLERPLPKMPL